MDDRKAIEELSQKLVTWLREQVAAAGAEGVVVGMSGGIDSSVVAVLCQQAFPHNVLGLLLPCHSLWEDIEHAYSVAERFRIQTRMVKLDAVYDALVPTLSSDEFAPATRKLAEANLRPRLRMLTLYYFANRLNYLVVGTGNRSEFAVGYFTKYGDGGVDLAPLGNLVKSQVRALAGYLGIPQEIIDKPPSAGLWQGQTDEGEMGLTYEEMDCYLLGREVRAETRRRIEQMSARSAHKRRLPPIPPF